MFDERAHAATPAKRTGRHPWIKEGRRTKKLFICCCCCCFCSPFFETECSHTVTYTCVPDCVARRLCVCSATRGRTAWSGVWRDTYARRGRELRRGRALRRTGGALRHRTPPAPSRLDAFALLGPCQGGRAEPAPRGYHAPERESGMCMSRTEAPPLVIAAWPTELERPWRLFLCCFGLVYMRMMVIQALRALWRGGGGCSGRSARWA